MGEKIEGCLIESIMKGHQSHLAGWEEPFRSRRSYEFGGHTFQGDIAPDTLYMLKIRIPNKHPGGKTIDIQGCRFNGASHGKEFSLMICLIRPEILLR